MTVTKSACLKMTSINLARHATCIRVAITNSPESKSEYEKLKEAIKQGVEL